jgi:hypothetical protein
MALSIPPRPKKARGKRTKQSIPTIISWQIRYNLKWFARNITAITERLIASMTKTRKIFEPITIRVSRVAREAPKPTR